MTEKKRYRIVREDSYHSGMIYRLQVRTHERWVNLQGYNVDNWFHTKWGARLTLRKIIRGKRQPKVVYEVEV